MAIYGVRVAILANENLGRDIAELLTPSGGRPSQKPVVWDNGFRNLAASWTGRCSRPVSNSAPVTSPGYSPFFETVQLECEVRGGTVKRVQNVDVAVGAATLEILR